jgi:hypothetical protein
MIYIIVKQEHNNHTGLSFLRSGSSGNFVAEAVDKIWLFAFVGKFMTELCFML